MAEPALLSIVGMGRSGSTYFEGRVSQLYGGVAVGELIGTWGAFARAELLCTCGKSPRGCPFWRQVHHRYPGLTDPGVYRLMTGTNRRVMPVRRLRTWASIVRDPDAGEWAAYRREARALYQAVAEAGAASGFRLVIDSSKHAVFYALTDGQRPGFSQELCVRLVRDPRAVAYSLSRPKTEMGTAGDRVIQQRYTPNRALGSWLTRNVFADRVTASDAQRFRYEDFGAEPYLAWLDERLERSGGGAQHQLVANPSRQDGDREFALDERWRSQARLRTTVTGLMVLPWLRRYGYSVRP